MPKFLKLASGIVGFQSRLSDTPAPFVHVKWRVLDLTGVMSRTLKGRIPLPSYWWHHPLSWVSAAAAKSLQSCPTLCDPIDGSPPGSPVRGILQARTLEWVAISFSNAWKWKVKVKSLSRARLSDPMGCNLRNFSIHGIFQTRVLGWGAITFSKLSV